MTSLLTLADSIARDAADLARRRRAEGVRVAATKSSIVDVVTDADREVESFVVDRILAARPNDGILGEEGSQVAGSSGLTWVIDPIDGTVNYLYDLPDYAVSVAVVEGDGDPATWNALVGVVVNGATGEQFQAEAGKGASRDGSEMRIQEPAPLEQALIGTGFGYDPERRRAQAAVIAGLIGQVRDIRRMGSAALDLANVGAGRLDAYFERGLNPWDHAAGALIAAEAGARVQGLDGQPDARCTLAGHPKLVAALAPLLHDLGAWNV